MDLIGPTCPCLAPTVSVDIRRHLITYRLYPIGSHLCHSFSLAREREDRWPASYPRWTRISRTVGRPFSPLPLDNLSGKALPYANAKKRAVDPLLPLKAYSSLQKTAEDYSSLLQTIVAYDNWDSHYLHLCARARPCGWRFYSGRFRTIAPKCRRHPPLPLAEQTRWVARKTSGPLPDSMRDLTFRFGLPYTTCDVTARALSQPAGAQPAVE